MEQFRQYLGFIPARSGSQRLPDKNVLPFASASLIEVAVAGALSAKSIDRVGISTDSPDYIERVKKAGLNETYLRPAHLAQSDSTVADCVIHYLDFLETAGEPPVTHVVLLQPTSPFRTAGQIDAAISQFETSEKPSLVSVISVAPRPELIVWKNQKTGKLRQGNAQDTSSSYVLDGAIYISPVETLREQGKFWNEDSALYVTNGPRYFDIDTDIDFRTAEALAIHEVLPTT